MKNTFFILLLITIQIIFAQKIDIKKDTINLGEVLVQATRATKKAPFSKSTLSKTALNKNNLGQDIPQLLQLLPNVVSTSDAGAGIGYTGIRVRGSDASRVNVTINGIPFNDSESQGTYWVNLPDFVSSVESIQLQRGVGTSTNGAGAFGASLSLETDGLKDNFFVTTNNTLGSFNTQKHNLKIGSGLLNNHFSFVGRVSTIKSDGYVDRASSDLRSLYLEANYVAENHSVKALAFGGSEVTYQSWYGLDATELENDRTYNPAGAIYAANGDISFYDNQVDDYKQDHYQLHYNRFITENWSANVALHYTYGRGFYEQYKQDEDFYDYNITPITINGTIIDHSDLVRQKWLKNDFYGTTFSVKRKTKKHHLIVGGAWNKYIGDHFGKVTWTKIGATKNDAYYENTGTKTDFNIFGKIDYKLTSKLDLFGDFQYRKLDYKVNGIDDNQSEKTITDSFSFINPKVGVTYTVNKANNFYFSYARANKEPKRADYESEIKPESEQLNDFEMGWRFNHESALINANIYYMSYKNQLVLTGALNDVGTPISSNIGESYRLGLEVDYSFILWKDKLFLRPSIAISKNRNKNKYEKIDGEITDLGDTNLSFSPNIVVSNLIQFVPFKNFEINFESKYIGDQYMSNINHKDSKLTGYAFSNLQVQYVIKPKKFLKKITLKTLVNNIFNYQYESNGYFYSYDDMWSNPNQTTTIYGSGYYPQAGIHFLSGVTLQF